MRGIPSHQRESRSATVAEHYKVRVSKDYLVFCAAHFITYDGDTCERLHGHNYRTAVEVEGPLDENYYVVDFIALKDLVRELTNELDHRMLLPTRSRSIRVEEKGDAVEVRFEDRRWSFPRDDCVLLPLENTTAELLARWLGERIRADLARRMGAAPAVVRVEVEESFGQSAVCELTDR
jgi:6-pyruvoyltetrahydropterin/6-carboxytetrahydropterin synthase